MAVPVINTIQAFDASVGTSFTFTYTGNQITNMQYYLYNADTLNIIYRNISDAAFMKAGTTPVKAQATIPSNAGLENGKRYFVRVRVMDAYGGASEWSNSTYFSCYNRPTMSFEGLDGNDKIKSQSLTVTVTYQQTENEKLQSYWFNLYDESLNLISTSKNFFDIAEVDGVVTLTYTYTNLVDDTTYFIRCSGTTIHGMSCDTGLLQIEVDYKFYDDFALLYLSNDAANGRIETQGNLKIIWPDEYYEEFEFDDSYVHLEDRQLHYNKGFNIEDNFMLWLKGRIPYTRNVFLTLYNETYTIELEAIPYDTFMRFKLTVQNGLDDVILYSDPVPPFEDYLGDFVWYIRRVGNIYQLAVRDITDSLADVIVSAYKPDLAHAKPGRVWINGDEIDLVEISKERTYTSEGEPEVTGPVIWIGGEK